MRHEQRLIVLRVPTGGSGEAVSPSKHSECRVGLAAPEGEAWAVGSRSMEPKPTCHTDPATPRYAAVVVPDYKGDEKRLVIAAPKEPCTT